ncbi:hypothetical protein TNIN_78661 [Trichonephila inaurata madagascariensis]|uniref:Uncharacterized protein n=1 Tax=Trichonephila inaurata madagascariensis TaxID=2747483 RepID=A0A8X6XM71_9ARAC|nr:hypothetical protein TNIN_78661 [Trichonephila inaurata madagascariensis]
MLLTVPVVKSCNNNERLYLKKNAPNLECLEEFKTVSNPVDVQIWIHFLMSMTGNRISTKVRLLFSFSRKTLDEFPTRISVSADRGRYSARRQILTRF